jgi:hypothetical protein
MAERSNDPKSLDLGKQFDPKKFKVEIKTAEDPTEKDYRLRQEFFSFLVKDLCTYYPGTKETHCSSGFPA